MFGSRRAIAKNSYVIKVPEATEIANLPADSPEPILALLASADVAAGAVSKKCTACHVFEAGGANKVGPALWSINKAKRALMDMPIQQHWQTLAAHGTISVNAFWQSQKPISRAQNEFCWSEKT